MKNFTITIMLYLTFSEIAFAEDAKPEKLSARAQTLVDVCKHDVEQARKAYHFAALAARDKLVVGLTKELDVEIKKGNLDKANAIKSEIERIKSPDFIADVEKKLDQEKIAESAKKIIQGNWSVKVGPTFQAEWRFSEDGKVLSSSGRKGQWKIESEKNRVLIVWDNSEAGWDSFDLPLDPNGTNGKHDDAGMRVQAKKKP